MHFFASVLRRECCGRFGKEGFGNRIANLSSFVQLLKDLPFVTKGDVFCWFVGCCFVTSPVNMVISGPSSIRVDIIVVIYFVNNENVF